MEVKIEEALGRRFPEQLALIVSRDLGGKINFCPIGYFCLASHNPRVWMIGVYKDHYTNKVISYTKEFVLCIPSMEQANDLLYCGSHHGWEVDKVKHTNFVLKDSKFIKVPFVENSVASFECKVIRDVVVGDHTSFFGQVSAAHVSNKTWRDRIYNWDDKRLGNLKYGSSFVEVNFSPHQG